MPQLSYIPPTQFLAGQILEPFNPHGITSFIYPAIQQVYTVTVGGSDDGTYTIRAIGPEGTLDASFEASGNSTTEIVEGLVAAMGEDWFNLATTTVDGSDVAITFGRAGIQYQVSFPSNPGGGLSGVETTSPISALLPLGVGVVALPERRVRTPQAGDEPSDIYGVTVRGSSDIASHVVPPLLMDGYLAPAMVGVMYMGPIGVQVEEAVSFNMQAFVRVDGDAPAVMGAFRGDDDGGNAVPIRARFRTSTTGAGIAAVQLDLGFGTEPVVS